MKVGLKNRKLDSKTRKLDSKKLGPKTGNSSQKQDVGSKNRKFGSKTGNSIQKQEILLIIGNLNLNFTA